MPPPPDGTLSLHGHVHRGQHRDREYAADVYFQRHGDRYRLVQIEDSLAPVALEEVLATSAD